MYCSVWSLMRRVSVHSDMWVCLKLCAAAFWAVARQNRRFRTTRRLNWLPRRTALLLLFFYVSRLHSVTHTNRELAKPRRWFILASHVVQFIKLLHFNVPNSPHTGQPTRTMPARPHGTCMHARHCVSVAIFIHRDCTVGVCIRFCIICLYDWIRVCTARVCACLCVFGPVCVWPLKCAEGVVCHCASVSLPVRNVRRLKQREEEWEKRQRRKRRSEAVPACLFSETVLYRTYVKFSLSCSHTTFQCYILRHTWLIEWRKSTQKSFLKNDCPINYRVDMHTSSQTAAQARAQKSCSS